MTFGWIFGAADIDIRDTEKWAKIDSDFDQVTEWSKAHDRPILLGEFGAREGGDMPSRVAWTSAVARSAERHGFAWAYWQFDSDFIVWNMQTNQWVRPIKDALIPAAGGPSCHP